MIFLAVNAAVFHESTGGTYLQFVEFPVVLSCGRWKRDCWLVVWRQRIGETATGETTIAEKSRQKTKAANEKETLWLHELRLHAVTFAVLFVNPVTKRFAIVVKEVFFINYYECRVRSDGRRAVC